VNLQVFTSKNRSFTWGRKDEEFAADFYLVSKRTLNEAEWKIFRYHYVIGAEWRFCCERLKMDRGTFFHDVYRIQQKLGRVFRELRPYALYPLDEYFSGNLPAAEPTAGSLPTGGRVVGLYQLEIPKAA
jgi:hypothetical protein